MYKIQRHDCGFAQGHRSGFWTVSEVRSVDTQQWIRKRRFLILSIQYISDMITTFLPHNLNSNSYRSWLRTPLVPFTSISLLQLNSLLIRNLLHSGGWFFLHSFHLWTVNSATNMSRVQFSGDFSPSYRWVGWMIMDDLHWLSSQIH